MKLTTFIIFSFLFCLFLPAYAQNSSGLSGEVTYQYVNDVQGQQERLDKMKRNNPQAYNNYGHIIRLTNEFEQTVNMTLVFNGSKSIFKAVEGVEPTGDDESLAYSGAMINAMSATDGFYLDRDSRTRILQKKIEGAQVNVVADYNKFNWQLTGEEKCVGGRTLLEAKTMLEINGRNGIRKIPVYAWYAPDIPVSYGPAGFDGLPGLIMELRKGEKRIRGYNAITVSIDAEEREMREVKKPKSVAEMTEGDYQRRMQEIYQRRTEN